MFKQPYEKAVKKWNGYEYLEFCEFETVQKLFEARYIQGKRGSKLFRSLGLTRKKFSRRHPKSRRRYIRKIQPIPLSRLEKTIDPKTLT
jgi:Lhr-like helicase